MQHVEFFHKDHFEYHYHRKRAKGLLARFIDFFWETDFDALWARHPAGFSDALFPNVGYTYLINLGTPFVMQLGTQSFDVRGDGFLPRHQHMICHHAAGNRIFGIKFKVSPVLFERNVNFSEYREYIFPLAYLIDRNIVDRMKTANDFDQRVALIAAYYNRILEQHGGSLPSVSVVTEILNQCPQHWAANIEDLAGQHGISSRTLQRYFEKATGIGSKQALQILRIRSAVEQLATQPSRFDYRRYGYYDYSHFYKHLKAFVNSPAIELVQPHLALLKKVA